jgi:CO/xanthine dehydrogenase FAD-binding subunit
MMIYIKPETVEEAVKAITESKHPLIYSGGTEIVTMIRSGKIHPKTLIDLKGIMEYTSLLESDESWTIGGGVTLNRIVEMSIPLLSEVAGKVADHTVRNALTVAGNICGKLPYREIVVPLMMLQANIEIVGLSGRRVEKITDVFNRRLMIKAGEWVMSIKIKKEPVIYRTIRRTQGTAIDYPVVHMMGIKLETGILMGCAGLFTFPHIFKSDSFVAELPVLSDQRASSNYREHLARIDFESIKEALS